MRDLNPPRFFMTDNEFFEYQALATNALKIDCLDPSIKFGYLEENFVKYQIINANGVGYDRLLNMFAKAYGYGLNEYWQPDELTFVYPNRMGYTRKISYEPNPDGAYYIQGFPGNITLADIIQKATDTMHVCDSVIIQNLEASKTPQYILVKNKDTRLSVLNAINQRNAGEPVIVIDETLGDGMKGIPNVTNFIVPEVYEFRENIRDRLLNKLGTMTANINKRERVQVGEVNATVGQCEDYLYAIIDNVNRQFKSYDLPFKMSLNTSLEELYLNDANTTDDGENNTGEPVGANEND